MARRKGRRRSAHRGRGAASSTARRVAQPTPPGPLDPDRGASAARAPSGHGTDRVERSRPRFDAAEQPGAARAGPSPSTAHRFARLGSIPTALLPGRAFFAMGRPVPGLVCCVLQASLLGWLPAALWAIRAERRVANKQRGLAARLRPF